mmetsp:Transcript_10072/g.25766  ORF Transcript_10072/g.25766 Transcript_10072/m.25766 type:complete len:227 (-) Transcript_10072:59-739(-)
MFQPALLVLPLALHRPAAVHPHITVGLLWAGRRVRLARHAALLRRVQLAVGAPLAHHIAPELRVVLQLYSALPPARARVGLGRRRDVRLRDEARDVRQHRLVQLRTRLSLGAGGRGRSGGACAATVGLRCLTVALRVGGVTGLATVVDRHCLRDVRVHVPVKGCPVAVVLELQRGVVQRGVVSVGDGGGQEAHAGDGDAHQRHRAQRENQPQAHDAPTRGRVLEAA